MKKIFLYLMFVLLLSSFINGAWFIDNTSIYPNIFNSLGTWGGNHIKILNNNANKINIIKESLVTANICAVFDVNSFTYLSENFTFNGNNCSITYNFLNNTEYILALYRSDSYTYNSYYQTPTTPFNTTNIEWINIAFNNIPNNWSFYNNYINDFGYLEINLSIPEIPPINITPNKTTENITGDLNNIANSLTLIGNNIYIIFIGLLMCLFLYLGYKINYMLWVVSGVLFWFIGLLDFNGVDTAFTISKFIFYVIIGFMFIILGFVLELSRENKQKPKNMYEGFY